MSKSQWIGLIMVASSPLVVLGSGINSAPYLPGSNYTDFLITHYPNIAYIQQAIHEFGRIPLWSDLIFSGYPFYADPLSSLFYPPMWISWALPQPKGLNLIVLLHLIFGGIGIFLLITKTGYSYFAGIVGMVSFCWMPKLIAHLGAGHITLIMAMCWMPWVLLGVEFVRENHKFFRYLSGVSLGMMILADPRIFPYGLFLLIFYSLCVHRHLSLAIFRQALFNFGISLFIAAPLIIPMVRYIFLSQRAQMTLQDKSIFSIPPERLMGLIFPDLGGNPEMMVYFGGFGLISLGAYWFTSGDKKHYIFWFSIFLISMVYALGEKFFLFPLLSSIPGMDLLRVPSRTVLIAGLSLCIMSGMTADKLVDVNANKSFWVAMSCLIILTATFSVGVAIILQDVLVETLIGSIFILGAILLVLISKRSMSLTHFMLPVFIFINLIIVNLSLVEYRTISYPHASTLKQYLENEVPYHRIYSPSNSVDQSYAAMNSLKLANGINPLFLREYQLFMTNATGVPDAGYSVSIPPFASGDPNVDNREYKPDLELLGRLGVQYIISDFPLTIKGIDLLFQDQIYIYINNHVRPLAWLQRSGDEIDQTYWHVSHYQRTPDNISITATGPAQLVISENAYPGWECRVDGKQTKIIPIDILMSLNLASGEHTIDCKFRPIDMLIGICISIATWSSLIILMFRSHREK